MVVNQEGSNNKILQQPNRDPSLKVLVACCISMKIIIIIRIVQYHNRVGLNSVFLSQYFLSFSLTSPTLSICQLDKMGVGRRPASFQDSI